MKTIYNSTRDDNGQFRTGYKMTEGRKYITIEYLTNVQGYQDKTYRMPIAEFTSPEAAIMDIQAGNLLPVKVGEVIR